MISRSIPTGLLLLTTTITQTAVAQHSGLGIKGGPLMSDTRSGAMSTSFAPGITAGLYFPLRAGPRMELQPELLVSALGSSYILPDGDRTSIRILYAQLPLTAKLYFSNVLNVQGGLQLGRLLSAQQIGPKGNANVTSSYNHIDGGLILGAGADLVTGADFTLRYYNGLLPILKGDQALFPRNRAYMVTVGYRLTRLRPVKNNRRRH